MNSRTATADHAVMNDRVAGLRIDQNNVDSMQLDGEAVLLNLATHAYFGLNATGTQVWELIRNHAGITADDIAETLAHRYGHEAPAVGTDVAAVIGELVQHGLVGHCEAAQVLPAQSDADAEPYERPNLQAYGNLDTLILSGE
jgi:hypothetical protein